jgi:predicted nucleic acid-binding protein
LDVQRIVNASPLILLSKVDQLDLLRVGADEVIVPDKVIEDLRRSGMYLDDDFVNQALALVGE